MERLKQHLK
ncbi:MAG: hypothetical protein EZS28_046882, partial [Streblomastix strix]